MSPHLCNLAFRILKKSTYAPLDAADQHGVGGVEAGQAGALPPKVIIDQIRERGCAYYQHDLGIPNVVL